ncbi:hypothetical protein [Halovulum marinum]|uniref:hypothetical protein n=1 Tax=Halovulum marinum TaxID=2662447 RepID=UPI0012B1A0A1|nr:hypothetical protein [Halovulum marinum]
MTIGTRMPPWLPRPLHAPARVLLGLALGAALLLYAGALALLADRVLVGWAQGALPAPALAGLLALLAAGPLLKRILVRRRPRR